MFLCRKSSTAVPNNYQLQMIVLSNQKHRALTLTKLSKQKHIKY